MRSYHILPDERQFHDEHHKIFRKQLQIHKSKWSVKALKNILRAMDPDEVDSYLDNLIKYLEIEDRMGSKNSPTARFLKRVENERHPNMLRFEVFNEHEFIEGFKKMKGASLKWNKNKSMAAYLKKVFYLDLAPATINRMLNSNEVIKPKKKFKKLR